MKISVTWLKELVPMEWPVDRLAAELTRIGLPVEGIEKSGADLTGFVVGHVVEAGRHPNADRLTLCTVDVGQAEPVQIICGAPNAAVGVRAAVALTGAVLPDGTKIKRAKLRGVESNGMMCSERELGLSGEHDGIIDLGPDAPAPGTPLADVMPAGDTVLDIDIPSNRGDCHSHVGVAREVAALNGATLTLPETRLEEAAEFAADTATVSVEDADGCPCYLARVITNVTVGPSPEWLVNKLRSVGQRSISNVVDVTNLVLWEMGQPLHAFDLDRLAGRSIRVRRAAAGETLTTLDGTERTLTPDVLVIADRDRAVALAGIMGGLDTEVTGGTKTILLEGAFFDGHTTLKGSLQCRLTTDASLRFVRGVDPAGVKRAIDRCAALLAEVSGGQVLSGRVEVVRPGFLDTRTVLLRPGAAERLLGEPVTDAESVAFLERLGFGVGPATGEGRSIEVPAWRLDVTQECDLVEEVARLHGYDRLGERHYNVSGLASERTDRQRFTGEIRRTLCGLGFHEMLTKALVDPADVVRTGVGEEELQRVLVRIPEPQSREEGALRPGLVAEALKAIRLNIHHGTADLRLFEVGTVFSKNGNEPLPAESVEVCIVATEGDFGPDLTRSDPRMDFGRFKGVVETLLDVLRVDTPKTRCYDENGFEPKTSVVVESRGRRIGAFGRVAMDVCKAMDISRPVFMARFILDTLIRSQRGVVEFREPSRFPASKRDLAFFVDGSVPESRVAELMKKLGGELLTEFTLFDRYTGAPGRPLPDGRVSLAYSLTWQSREGTLSDEQVRTAERRVIEGLEKELGAVLRDR